MQNFICHISKAPEYVAFTFYFIEWNMLSHEVYLIRKLNFPFCLQEFVSLASLIAHPFKNTDWIAVVESDMIT